MDFNGIMKKTGSTYFSTRTADESVPGGIYLCQVGERVSCGACCGLYNVADASRKTLVRVLQERTRRFARVPRTADAIEDFARQTQALEPRQRPFSQFHHCPFIGMIGANHSRAGCLLHPLAAGNEGVDFRGLSYYGGLACRTYFCPATHQMASRHKQILRSVIDDWHLYGLVVTETDLVGALFQNIEDRLGRPIETSLFENRPTAGRQLIQLLRLKIDWSYRPARFDTPCHYFFFDVASTKPDVDYTRLGAAPSCHADVLRELVSEFQSAEDLREAEQLVDGRLNAAARALCTV